MRQCLFTSMSKITYYILQIVHDTFRISNAKKRRCLSIQIRASVRRGKVNWHPEADPEGSIFRDKWQRRSLLVTGKSMLLNLALRRHAGNCSPRSFPFDACGAQHDATVNMALVQFVCHQRQQKNISKARRSEIDQTNQKKHSCTPCSRRNHCNSGKSSDS